MQSEPDIPHAGNSPAPRDSPEQAVAGTWQSPRGRQLWVAVLTLVAIGILWRVTRYLFRGPIWGDEAMLGLNLIQRGYIELFDGLNHCQVAPMAFLWIEKGMIDLAGPSEWSVRFPALLASIVGLLLFVRLAWRTLSPLAATIAIGFLAVAVRPVSMGTCLKPYAFDLMFAVAFVLLAVEWWLERRTIWLWLMAGLAPLVTWCSYPSVFVGGAVLLALFVPIFRSRSIRHGLPYLAFAILLVSTFVLHLKLVGGSQLTSGTTTGTTEQGMATYWKNAFPPTGLFPKLYWLVAAHCDEMMAVPIGDGHFASIGTTILAATGALWMLRTQRYVLATLCAAPFALNLLAAFLGKYPYGMADRLSQHLTPLVALLAGAGGAWLIHSRVRNSLQWRTVGISLALLICLGIGGTVRDIVFAGRSAFDFWARDLAAEILDTAGPNCPVVLLNGPYGTEVVLQWYLLNARTNPILWPDNWQAQVPSDCSKVCIVRWEVLPAGHPANTMPPPQAGTLIRQEYDSHREPLRGPPSTAHCHVQLVRLEHKPTSPSDPNNRPSNIADQQRATNKIR